MSERRERYRAAIRENDGWVLDDGQHMIDAVMAVADAELETARQVALEARADRAAVLGEAAERVASLRDKTDVWVAEYQRYSPSQRHALDDAVRAIQRLTATPDEQDEDA